MTLLKLTLFLGSTLIPDESSLVGKEVARLWKLINAVKVEIVTFGVVNFQDLSKSGLHPMAQGMKGAVVYRNNFYPPPLLHTFKIVKITPFYTEVLCATTSASLL